VSHRIQCTDNSDLSVGEDREQIGSNQCRPSDRGQTDPMAIGREKHTDDNRWGKAVERYSPHRFRRRAVSVCDGVIP